MISTINKHHWFIGIYILFLSLACYFLLSFSKIDSHLLLTSWHNSTADFFFKYATHLGDGLGVLAFALLGLIFSKRHFLQIGLSGLLSGIIAQFLKKVVYGPTPRPIKFFADTDYSIYQVPGVTMNEVFSYPSGHATSAFCLAASFAILGKSKRWDILGAIFGITVAYSRIYLSQHFLEDIVYGSIIGIVTAFIIDFLLTRWEERKSGQA